MENIYPMQEKNEGGNLYINWVEWDGVDFTQWPSVSDGNMATAITLKNGYSWGVVEFKKDTLQFSEEEQDGGGYVSQLNGQISKDIPELITILQVARRKRLILLCLDENGYTRVLGNEFEPVKMTMADRRTGDNPIGHNGYDLNFTCLRRDESPFYQNTIQSPSNPPVTGNPYLSLSVTPDDTTPTVGDEVTFTLAGGADHYGLDMGSDEYDEEQTYYGTGSPSPTRRYWLAGTKDISLVGGTTMSGGPEVINSSQITVGYDAAAAALIALTSLTTAEQNRIGWWEAKLKYHSLWDKITALYVFPGNIEGSQKFNLKDPQNTDAAFRLSSTGSPTRANGKVTGGSGIYLDTHVNIDTHVADFDLTMSVHISSEHSSNEIALGAYVNSARITQINTADSIGSFIHGSVTNIVSNNLISQNTGNATHTGVAQSNALREFYYKDQLRNVSTLTQAAFTNSNDIYLLARNDNGTDNFHFTQGLEVALIATKFTASEVAIWSGLCEENHNMI